MDKKAIQEELINIFNLFRAATDRDHLIKMCKEKGLLIEADKEEEEEEEEKSKEVTDYTMDQSTKVLINSVDSMVRKDVSTKKNYPKTLAYINQENIKLSNVLRPAVKKMISNYKSDPATLDELIQWVIVDIFTDVGREPKVLNYTEEKDAPKHGQNKHVFKSTEEHIIERKDGKLEWVKETKEGKAVDFEAVIGTHINNSASDYFKNEKRPKQTQTIQNDILKLQDELEAIKKQLKIDKEKGIEPKQRMLKKKEKLEDQLRKKINKVKDMGGVGLETQGPDKGEDPLKMDESLSDPSAILDGVDYFNEKATLELKKDFLKYSLPKVKPLAKKILELALMDAKEELDKEKKDKKANSGYTTHELAKELKVTVKEINDALDNIKKHLIDFAIKEDDTKLLNNLENKNLLPMTMLRKIRKERSQKEKEWKEKEKKDQKELEKKYKGKGAAEIKLARIVDYLETLFKRL